MRCAALRERTESLDGHCSKYWIWLPAAFRAAMTRLFRAAMTCCQELSVSCCYDFALSCCYDSALWCAWVQGLACRLALAQVGCVAGCALRLARAQAPCSVLSCSLVRCKASGDCSLQRTTPTVPTQTEGLAWTVLTVRVSTVRLCG